MTSTPPRTQAILNIGIVEDDRLTRMLLVDLIKREEGLNLVGDWETGGDFLAAFSTVPLDILLVDLELPDCNGTSIIKKVKAERPEVDCIVLTSSSNPDDLFDSLKGGASGYLIKQSSPRELLDGIRSVANDGVILSPKIAHFLVREFFERTPVQSNSENSCANVLTTREMEVLGRMADGATPKECASLLDLSYETIRAHLKKIYQKLHVNSAKEALQRFREDQRA
jgi:DNA-binding NarL/FixJ family response regulator